MDNAITNTSSYRYLTLGEDFLRFAWIEKGKVLQELPLDLGYRYISRKYFVSDIPSEGEVENAINYIEDILMTKKQLVNDSQNSLYTQSNFVFSILGESSYLSVQQIEDLFNRWASLSMGKPARSENIQYQKDHFALILIIREIIHHLQFEGINIIV
ncbi:hypothetical protein [Spirochaeta cellobiosiphila]|uniref:hypothetical protein n=1 Tax=Spirochaeta cellobiosiphila TaxID=504483 RepID=UPI0004078B05|nr:hypothetical protein [Spirochaeta cellobiosiphila]